MDPLEVATAFHREVDGAKAAGSASEHVNQIRYGKTNRIGLGSKDEARRLSNKLRQPTARHLSVVKSTPMNKGPLGF